MGSTFEVSAWKDDGAGKYADVQVYSGEVLADAILAMTLAKAECGCVTLKWRG
jgi:hypothetical protein